MFLRRSLWLLALGLVAAGDLPGIASAASTGPTLLCGHQLLQRQQERNALLPPPKPLSRQQLLRSRRASTLSIAGTPTAPKVGDKAKFWGLDFTAYDGSDGSIKHYRLNATLKRVTENAYLYVEDGAPAGDRSIARLAQAFEGKILPQEQKYFGTPRTPGIDGDPRVTLLIMNLRSLAGAADPLDSSAVTIGGFFNDEDEYPNDDKHPYSNERQMVTLNANLDAGSSMEIEVLAHEFQHLIHWSYDRNEALWVNEGLSMVAPTVAGVGGGPESALGNAIMAYGLDYDNSLTEWGDRGQENITADYGAAGLFFLYLAEKYGGPEIYARVVRRQEHGIEGVLAGLKDAGYPVQFSDLFSRWAVANLADDSTLGEPPHYYGYRSPGVQDLRRSVEALHEMLPDLIPKLFQPTTRVKAFPTKGGASLRPQAAHYIELSGSGTLDLSFDGGGHPFEAFVLEQHVDGRDRLYPISLDPQSRAGSVKVPGLGTDIGSVYLIVTDVADEGSQAADYRYEANTE